MDSTTSRCNISHKAVESLRLFCCKEIIHLELVDDSKTISHGKYPHVYTSVGSTGGKTDFIVNKSPASVDIVLGISWLEVYDPLIS